MQFFSPVVTVTQQPVSQNVDYNQPVAINGRQHLAARWVITGCLTPQVARPMRLKTDHAWRGPTPVTNMSW